MDEATVRRHPTLTDQWCAVNEAAEVLTGDDHTKMRVDGAVVPLTGLTHSHISPALGKWRSRSFRSTCWWIIRANGCR